jgi:hypothetical protein
LGNLIKGLLDSFSKGFLSKLIKGAGISLISGTVILTVINFLIDRFISDFFVVGDLASLVGVSGLDQCISIVISAMIARAMISSTSMSFKRHKKTIAEGGGGRRKEDDNDDCKEDFKNDLLDYSDARLRQNIVGSKKYLHVSMKLSLGIFFNIDGLKLDTAQPLKDSFNDYPPRSLVVIDEAQKITHFSKNTDIPTK